MAALQFTLQTTLETVKSCESDIVTVGLPVPAGYTRLIEFDWPSTTLPKFCELTATLPLGEVGGGPSVAFTVTVLLVLGLTLASPGNDTVMLWLPMLSDGIVN